MIVINIIIQYTFQLVFYSAYVVLTAKWDLFVL